MHFTSLLAALVCATDIVLACPGALPVEGQYGEAAPHALPRYQRRQEDDDVNERMIGDLKTKGATTDVGRSIQNILLGSESGEDSTFPQIFPPRLGSRRCDECCVWRHISRTMTWAFTGRSLRCNDLARAAIRLGFHDAGSWDESSTHGGADGSLVLAGEVSRPENRGLETIVGKMQQWHNRYKRYGISMADLIQFAAIHATVTCPLGPRIRWFAGRKDSSTPAPDGLLPHPRDDPDNLIQLFEDKTISPHELAALLGAHSTSRQFHFDPSQAGAPQDGTPGVWDVLFYNQTVEDDVPDGVFRIPSDVALAKHPKMADEWMDFAQGNNVGQDHWNEDYAQAYTRLSLLGVDNINELRECPRALPVPRPDFRGKFKLFINE